MEKNKQQKKTEYFLFTACYLVFAVYSVGKCFCNQQIITEGTDGIAQYYPAMCYIADWLRNVVTNLLCGKLEIPLVDYTLGMGDDVLVTLNYYGFGDPFYLLSALVSEEGIPYFYTTLFFLRMYLGGVAFILLAKEVVPSKHICAYVLGAVIYISSGYSIVSNLYYNFVHALMYIPLMLYGLEMILKGKKKRWTVITVFFFALTGFFYLYVGMLICVAYMVFRFIVSREEVKEYFRKCLVWGISFLTGILLAAFLFLPEVMGYMQCSRSRVITVPLHYTLSQYKDMFFKLFFAKEANFQVLALPVIAIIISALIILSERHYKEKVVILLGVISFALPVVSYVMSGFGGIYDRWEIALVLLVSILVVKNWDELFPLTRYQRLGIINLYMLFLIIGYYEDLLSDDGYYRDSLLIFTFLLGCVFVFSYVSRKFHKRIIVQCGMFIVAIITIFIQINNNFRYYDISCVKEQNVVEELISDTSDEEFYRVDNEQVFSQEKPLLNLAFTQKYNGLGEYFSIISRDYITALSDWQILSENSYHSYGVNHRTILETLCNVKYFILKEGHEYLKPYGFSYVSSTQDGLWNMYKNEYSVPLGYTYSNVIDYDSYLNMNGIEKQQAMLEVVALQDYDGMTIKDSELKGNYLKGKCEIVECNGINILEDGRYHAIPGSSMKLLVELKSGCENYFMLENINSSILISYKDSHEYLEGVSLGTLGYASQDEELELTVEFGNDVVFNEEQLVIGYLSMDGYENALQHLREESQENVKISANKVSGNIYVNSDKILCLSLPYMKGWHAKLDGNDVKIYKANSMFMAIEVPAGNHTVEFSYCTPWLKTGSIISIITAIMCIIYWRIQNRKMKES